MTDLLYGNFVRSIANSFDGALAEIEAEYNFDLGREFEIAICKTLRLVLPHRFGICRGFVISADGKVAGDDIIIYERIRFPTFRQLDEDWSRKEKVPIEAVFAYIEAKHTLYLEGDTDSSLHKAAHQVSDVKTLCDQREPVPNRHVAQEAETLKDLHTSSRPGWPLKRNPVYVVIVSRQVSIQRTSQVLEDPVQIDKALVGRDVEVKHSPDLIIAGRSNIALPAIEHGDGRRTILSPFYVDGITEFACRITEDIAFGVGLAHLLWALDNIELGSMPWDLILGNNLGL